jgi:multisubunit Na+/H+ antiporter MnhE subunit
MNLKLPKPDYRARFLLLAYGLVLFIWMSLEDNGTFTVSLLGAGLATALILYQTLERIGGKELSMRFFIPLFVGIGALIGAASSFATIMLMFFKTAWHGHGFPDYPLELMRDMLFRLPIWAMVGGLIGLGLSFLYLSIRKQEMAK